MGTPAVAGNLNYRSLLVYVCGLHMGIEFVLSSGMPKGRRLLGSGC